MSSRKKEDLTLDAADTLAKFANLDSANVSDFRSRHPNFVPAALWKGQTANGAPPLWKIEQTRVRDAWRTKFPPESSVLMISEIAKFSALEQRMEQVVRMNSEQLAEQIEAQGKNWISKPESWPYQAAVMLLTMEPWRAMICGECGNRFVADHPKRKYCSITGADGQKCSARVIDRTHLEWGRENNWGREKAKRTRKKV